MKKLFLAFLAITVIFLLTSCKMGEAEEGSALFKSMPIEELIEATARGDSDAVRGLIHPGVSYSNYTKMYNDFSAVLEGKEIKSISENFHHYARAFENWNWGAITAEYTVKLEDENVVVSIRYSNSSEGAGFLNFQIKP